MSSAAQNLIKLIVHTVMRISKLKLVPVPVQLHSGYGKLKLLRYFTIFCDI